jgi:hypothetical protein
MTRFENINPRDSIKLLEKERSERLVELRDYSIQLEAMEKKFKTLQLKLESYDLMIMNIKKQHNIPIVEF